jgi:hypothetical protein
MGNHSLAGHFHYQPKKIKRPPLKRPLCGDDNTRTQQVQSAPVLEKVLLLHDPDVTIATGGRSHIDLGVAVVRIAPLSTLKKSMRRGDPTEGDATG